MSVTTLAALPTASSPVRLPYVRWACLGCLLIAELLVLTIRFDTEVFDGQSEWWAGWLGNSHLVPKLAIAIFAATLVLGGARLREELHRHTRALCRPGWWWAFLVAHLIAFAGFARLTAFVMEGGARATGYPTLWVLAWAMTGLAVAATWFAAAVPPSLWLPLFRRTAALLALGAAVGVTAWLAGDWIRTLWKPFHQATFLVVHGLLRLTGAELVCEPAQDLIGTANFCVRIAPECSGYEGMGLIAVFTAGYLWLCRRRLRFPAALALLPVGMTAMWLLNAVRIAALVLVGSWASPEVARGGFHSQAGWLAFNAVALGLVALSGRIRYLQTREADAPVPRAEGDTSAYLAPFCAILAVTMLTRAVSPGFDWLYPTRVIVAVAVLWTFRRHYFDCLSGGWSWAAVGLGVLAFGIWMALIPSPDRASEATMTAALGGASWATAGIWLVFRVLGAVITVPIAEELAFRGYLLRRLVTADFESKSARRFSPFAFLVSSALFGALHASWLAGMTAGMIYGLAFYRRGRVLDAVIAHATTNALLAEYVLLTGHWSLWS